MESIRALPCFFFLHSIVPLFSCSSIQMFLRSFFLPYSLSDLLASQDKNKIVYHDRALNRDCDHRNIGRNASSGVKGST